MSQLDRHLTTEELSVLLDDQFEPEEAGAELRGHLTTCQQCQYELTELRQTVHLLHALPQPALPRSFVLPAGILQITTTDTQTQNVSNIHISGSTNRTQQHGPTRTSMGRRIFNLVGTLAAVVGILFILSGFITVMPHMAASSSTASTTASAPIAMPANQSAASTASRSLAPAAMDATKQAAQGAQAVQAPDNVKPNSNTAQAQSTTSMQPAEKQEAAQSTHSSDTPSFLNLDATGVRIGFGILLFIAGMMGITVGRERRKGIKERSKHE